jgi:hypothetical protein
MAPEEPAPPCDRFIGSPWIAVLCLWIIVVLPLIFLGPASLLFSISVAIWVPVIGLILLIDSLFRLRWRAATSIVFASAAFALATFGSLKFLPKYSDELRWYVLRPYYVVQIAASSTGPDGVHGISWDGGLGWDVRLEYHEAEADALAWQQKQQQWLGSCKLTLKEIAPHYFLNGIYC